MKKIKILILSIFLLLSIGANSQCWLLDLTQNIENGSSEFKAFMKNNPDATDAYRILHQFENTSITDITILNKLANDLQSNADLRTFLNDIENFSTWRDISYLNNFTNNIGFLELLKKAKSSNLSIHLIGEVNSSGNAVGGHLLEFLDNINMRISNPSLTVKNANNEIIKAKIEILDSSTGNFVEKGPLSSFFPSNWNINRTLEEISAIMIDSSNQIHSRKFVGIASDGITEIEIRLTGPINNLIFDTAFPLIP